MTRICLYLLGAPRIEVDDRPAVVDTRKAVALLAYLAISEAVQARNSLAALLWPGYDQQGARAALRRTLSVLNKALGQEGLLITRETVAIAPSGVFWSDAGRFRQCLSLSRQHAHPPGEACAECLPFLEEAASLYRGDFMAGFSLRDSLSFDDWQFFQAEAFRQELGSVLERLARSYAERKGYETALGYARRWLALDPLREEAHRQLMLLYAWSGERNAALRQYRECVRILEQELGVPPLEETTSLYQNILENRLPAQPEPRTSGSPLAPAPEASPLKPVLQPGAYPLVGRQMEWQQLVRAYSQSASWRLLFYPGRGSRHRQISPGRGVHPVRHTGGRLRPGGALLRR